tara:strand:+ start:268 stop:705 length:438 start_codon:yes stop_codon:yes gene_type:complete
MASKEFKVDDLIVAFGSTISNEGNGEIHRILCRVIAAGKSDLVVRPETAPGSTGFRSKGRPFNIASDRCVLVSRNCKDISAEVRKPALGDLVLSIDDKYTSTEKKVGVLVEVIDVPGSAVLGRLLESEEFTTVPFNTLIVLESSD